MAVVESWACPKELSQNNFSKSTLLLYAPWRESPVFCLGIPGSCSSIQLPHGHRDTSFLKPYFWDGERDGALCRTQRSSRPYGTNTRLSALSWTNTCGAVGPLAKRGP